MTKYLMCIYWGHTCIFIPNIKFLSWILWLGGLCTDADNADTDDANSTDTNDADDADNTHNYAWRTNHDYIGSFGRIPNEPKTKIDFDHEINWNFH